MADDNEVEDAQVAPVRRTKRRKRSVGMFLMEILGGIFFLTAIALGVAYANREHQNQVLRSVGINPNGISTATGEPPTSTISVPYASTKIFTSVVGSPYFAGFRLTELLHGVAQPHEAVTRSPSVIANMSVNNDVATGLGVKLDTTTLQSDHVNRDLAYKTSVLETSKYPTAGFVSSGPFDLTGWEAHAVNIQLPGTLTVHGVSAAETGQLQIQRSPVGATFTLVVPFSLTGFRIQGGSGLWNNVQDPASFEAQIQLKGS